MDKWVNKIHHGDCLEVLRDMPDGCVQCCVTSPPYWQQRDYKVDGQIGMERNPKDYISKLVAVFREVHRVIADNGVLWLNIGDKYLSAKGTARNPGGRVGPGSCIHSPHKDAGVLPLWRPNISEARAMQLKHKDLIGIPWMIAFALRDNGWYLRSEVIWSKLNSVPENVNDRPTRSHEHLFLFSKSQRYFYNQEAIREEKNDDGKNGKGANKKSVWRIAPASCKEAHFAVFPEALIEPCIIGGKQAGGRGA